VTFDVAGTAAGAFFRRGTPCHAPTPSRTNGAQHQWGVKEDSLRLADARSGSAGVSPASLLREAMRPRRSRSQPATPEKVLGGAIQHKFLRQVILPFCPACGAASPLPTRRTQSAARHEDVVRTAAEQPSPVSMKHKYMHGYRHWHILVSHRRRRPFCDRLLHSAPWLLLGCSWLIKGLKRRLLAAYTERDGVQSDFSNSPVVPHDI
jgi:hypothetical protein